MLRPKSTELYLQFPVRPLAKYTPVYGVGASARLAVNNMRVLKAFFDSQNCGVGREELAFYSD